MPIVVSVLLSLRSPVRSRGAAPRVLALRHQLQVMERSRRPAAPPAHRSRPATLGVVLAHPLYSAKRNASRVLASNASRLVPHGYYRETNRRARPNLSALKMNLKTGSEGNVLEPPASQLVKAVRRMQDHPLTERHQEQTDTYVAGNGVVGQDRVELLRQLELAATVQERRSRTAKHFDHLQILESRRSYETRMPRWASRSSTSRKLNVKR
jgi:hypothetical protein